MDLDWFDISIGFIIKFVLVFLLLAILPIWFLIKTGDVNIVIKLAATAIMGVIIFIALKTGGSKRGFLTKWLN